MGFKLDVREVLRLFLSCEPGGSPKNDGVCSEWLVYASGFVAIVVEHVSTVPP